MLLSCAFNDSELRTRFAAIEFAEHGISFGDGSARGKSAGTLIYRGVAFDYAVADATKPDDDHGISIAADPGDARSSLNIELGAAVASGGQVPAIVGALESLRRIFEAELGAQAKMPELATK